MEGSGHAPWTPRTVGLHGACQSHVIPSAPTLLQCGSPMLFPVLPLCFHVEVPCYSQCSHFASMRKSHVIPSAPTLLPCGSPMLFPVLPLCFNEEVPCYSQCSHSASMWKSQ